MPILRKPRGAKSHSPGPQHPCFSDPANCCAIHVPRRAGMYERTAHRVKLKIRDPQK